MPRLPGLKPLLAPIALLLLASGCATSGAVSAAQRGDHAALRQLLDQDVKAGKFGGGDARDVARAVASREISEASGSEGTARLDELRACAPKLEGALEDRAKKDDDIAARAALLLIDEGLVSTGHWEDKLSSTDGLWRAVGARSLTSRGDGEQRRALFVDVFDEVRVSALKAAIEAQDPLDASGLLEVVRLDPEPRAREQAARAVGYLGGEQVALGLRDRWPGSGGDRLAAAIITAWATAPTYETGGRAQLFWVAETQHGAPAIVAATQLLRHGGDDTSAGRAALLRALDESGATNKVMVINLADLSDDAEKKAVVAASESTDPQVQVAALSRMTEDAALRDAALDKLGQIAVSSGLGRNAARSALAKAKDRRVVGLLAEDVSSEQPGTRAWAAQQLAGMKEFPQAAPALADDDASVRTRAACAILTMPK